VVVKARDAASPLGEPHPASLMHVEKNAVRAMKKFRRRTFVVVEGSTVIGSFETLREALEFRTKSGSRSARIAANRGDQARVHRVKPSALWRPQLLERL